MPVTTKKLPIPRAIGSAASDTRSTAPAAAIPAVPMVPSRSARTRERILNVSLALFNTQGEANVTTGHIADELNISPGNLYYHFRNKDEIIHHLFAEFEREIDVAPAGLTDVASAMEDLWLYLHMMFERIWQYRFLYRNLDRCALIHETNRKFLLWLVSDLSYRHLIYLRRLVQHNLFCL